MTLPSLHLAPFRLSIGHPPSKTRPSTLNRPSKLHLLAVDWPFFRASTCVFAFVLDCIRHVWREMHRPRIAGPKFCRNRRSASLGRCIAADNPRCLTDRTKQRIRRWYSPDARPMASAHAQHATASAPVGCEPHFSSQPSTLYTNSRYEEYIELALFLNKVLGHLQLRGNRKALSDLSRSFNAVPALFFIDLQLGQALEKFVSNAEHESWSKTSRRLRDQLGFLWTMSVNYLSSCPFA